MQIILIDAREGRDVIKSEIGIEIEESLQSADIFNNKALIVIEFQLNMDVSRMIFYVNSSVTTCAILLIYLCCHLLSYYLIHTLVQDH